MVAHIPDSPADLEEMIERAPADNKVVSTSFTEEEFRQHGFMLSPYTTRLNFAPIIRKWKDKIGSADPAEALLAREIMTRVEQAPELNEPFDHIDEMAAHQETISLLLAGLFPLSLRDTQLAKAGKPFEAMPIYQTPAMERHITKSKVIYHFSQTPEQVQATIKVSICALILNKCYGQKIDLDPNIVLTIECPDSNLCRHYRAKLIHEFTDVIPLKKPTPLSPQQVNELLTNIYDTEAWMKLLPPSHFEIHGLTAMEFIDITREESLSRLKYKLIEKDAILRKDSVQELQRLLRSFFGISKLRMGISAIDYPKERHVRKYQLRNDLLAECQECLISTENTNSIYDKACRYKEVLLVEDLEKLPLRTSVEDDLIAMGLRSIIVAPLLNQAGQVIGLFEIASAKPYELHSIIELRFRELLPLFSMAMERSREEIDNKIDAIIREQFTMVHPSVEWRFEEAAYKYLENLNNYDKKAAIDEISFDEVYPLFAQADIVNSSTLRNAAIQDDFIDNLKRIEKVLTSAGSFLDFPLVQYFLQQTQQQIEEISKEIRSNDEPRLMDFITNEIHPLFRELAQRDNALALETDRYFSQLDPHHHVIYSRRKDYEQSVSHINDTISDYLEVEDTRAQQMTPHYFEKYKTDGVEFEIYAGQSLLRTGNFSALHLHNLRLWQLLAMCHITRRVAQMRNEIPLPLQTAQLIFVYSQPISIRFRMDEKRFDVDGAYNVRYEIIKKRIDKALIEGRNERLRQAGKIAIVYTTEKDRLEYLEYLNYLIAQGIIEDEVEELILERLQGVQGLRALRVTVRS